LTKETDPLHFSLNDLLRPGPSEQSRLGAKYRSEITRKWLNGFSKRLGCESEFEFEQKQPKYPEAFKNYNDVLWRWVFEQEACKEVVQKFCDFPVERNEAANIYHAHEYLLARAIFLDGLKRRERFDPKHYQFFAPYFPTADKLDDITVFQAAAQQKWNMKTAQAQEGRTAIERQLKHCLLTAWLPGGLWRMGSRQDQKQGLQRFWPTAGKYTHEALRSCERKLGLTWPV
jgi:hypothetical protein